METASDKYLWLDGNAILRFFGRIQDYNAIFIPTKSKLAILLVKYYHKKTLHGGVSLTVNSLRERLLTPELGSLSYRNAICVDGNQLSHHQHRCC